MRGGGGGGWVCNFADVPVGARSKKMKELSHIIIFAKMQNIDAKCYYHFH